jgi:hypothetical protein
VHTWNKETKSENGRSYMIWKLIDTPGDLQSYL